MRIYLWFFSRVYFVQQKCETNKEIDLNSAACCSFVSGFNFSFVVQKEKLRSNTKLCLNNMMKKTEPEVSCSVFSLFER